MEINLNLNQTANPIRCCRNKKKKKMNYRRNINAPCLYVFLIQFFEVLCRKDIRQNSFTHLKAIPVMNHHHKSLLRYNLRELLTQKFQTLLSKRKQRSWDHDTQSAAVTQLWAGCFSSAGLSGSQQGQRLNFT